MDLENIGIFIFCTLVVGVMIAIIVGAIKYIKDKDYEDIRMYNLVMYILDQEVIKRRDAND